MAYLPDNVVERLRRKLDEPELAGTRYRLLGRLGQGGMGVVWLAEDTLLARKVALKVMSFDEGDERLLGEARTLAGLEHPGIVPVHDAGELADGRRYYAMKYVEGPRLDEAVAGASLFERLRWFQKICEAVAFAHSRGVVHRDLKPQNIMVGAFGEILVLDWAAVAGTPGYMAPEQAAGGVVDGRSDVHALGVLLEGMAEGAARPLRAIAARARAAAPEARYQSVAQLAAEVEAFVEGNPVAAYRERWWESAARVYRRHQVLILLLAAYVVVKFALFFVSLIERNAAAR